MSERVFEDNFVRKILNNQNWLQAFPFLKSFQSLQVAGKRKCCYRPEDRKNLNAAKAALASISPEQVRVLKDLAHADKVRIVYRGANGKAITRIF